MQRARLAAAAAVMALAAVTCAGCSSGDDSGGQAAPLAAPIGLHATPLVRELNEIRSTEASRAWTRFGDNAAQRALGGGKIPAELAVMSAYGWPTTWERSDTVQEGLALDGNKADQTVEVGEEHGFGRFDGGIDTGAVITKAKKMGAHEDGTAGPLTLWRLADDNSVHLKRGLAELSRGTADFNVLAVDKDTLVRAPSRADAQLLSADGAKGALARDQRFRAVADCLDRPLAAALTDNLMPMGGMSPEPADFVTGAGVVGSSPKDLTQVACRTTGSKDEAEKVASALREQLAHGKTRLSGIPWRDWFSGAKVTVLPGAGHVVKFTGTSLKSSQVVLELLRSGDLTDLLDTSG